MIVKALAENNTVLGETKVVEISKPKPKPSSTSMSGSQTPTSKPDSHSKPHEDQDDHAEDPYWYSDIVFYIFCGAIVAILGLITAYLVRRRWRGGAAGPRRSLLDMLSRGRYKPLRDDERELQEREGKDSLLNGHRRGRRGSDDDVFADQFSLGSGDEDSDAEDVEGGKLRQSGEDYWRR